MIQLFHKCWSLILVADMFISRGQLILITSQTILVLWNKWIVDNEYGASTVAAVIKTVTWGYAADINFVSKT